MELDPHKGISVVALCVSVQRCEGLSMVLHHLKETLEVFIKRGRLLHGSGFLSYCDNLSC